MATKSIPINSERSAERCVGSRQPAKVYYIGPIGLAGSPYIMAKCNSCEYLGQPIKRDGSLSPHKPRRQANDHWRTVPPAHKVTISLSGNDHYSIRAITELLTLSLGFASQHGYHIAILHQKNTEITVLVG